MDEIADLAPLPSAAQLAYHRDELAAFIHFGINTFYEQEWGNGQEDPRLFNPSKLDTGQWIRILKESGFKRVVVVVKHATQTIRWQPAPGEMAREIYWQKFHAQLVCMIWIWAFTCLLGMLTVHSIILRLKKPIMNIIRSNWKKF